MDQDFLHDSVTRRSIVKTGVKLAYAAPLVAATMKLSSHGAFAAVISGGTTQELEFCGHSVVIRDGDVRDENWGCMQACKTAKTGDCAKGKDACSAICETCKTPPGKDNPCPSFGYCTASNFVCQGGSIHYIG